MLSEAIAYASFGWRIFPCHAIVHGSCTCNDPNCSAPGKHPRTRSGVKDATRDEEQIRRWWTSWPDANIALACGVDSGVVVIDIDPRNGGFDSLDEYEGSRPGGPLPSDLMSETGGGGRHIFLRVTKETPPIGNKTNWLPGVDVKSDGGYVILPPGTHASGGSYRWLQKNYPPEAPLDVISDLRTVRPGQSDQSELASVTDLLKGVPEGQRDVTLFRQACKLRRKLDNSFEAVWLIIKAAAAACEPPFPEEQALAKVKQAFRQDHDDDDDDGASKMASVLEELDIPRFTDEGNAERFIRMFRDEMRFVRGIGWLEWNGYCWVRDGSKNAALHRAGQLYDVIVSQMSSVTKRDVKKIGLQWAVKSESLPRIEAAARLAASDPRLEVAVRMLDANPMLLNLRSGTLNLETGEMYSHVRHEMHTMASSVMYDPKLNCPEWIAFLEKILPSADVRLFVQRALGYSLTGLTSEKVMFILYGEGNNGKTVFLEAVKDILGDYGGTAAKSVFVQRRQGSESHPTDIASLVGKRFITCSEEIGERDSLYVERIKSITGGDELKARFMRQDEFTFMPKMKLWLGTNHEPGLNDFGSAMRDRLRIVPFTVQVPRHEQIARHEMMRRFSEEAAGILNWMIAGCLDWQENGLPVPLEMQVAVDDYMSEQDTLRLFIDEYLEQIPHNESGFVSNEEVYAAYAGWCMQNGMRVSLNSVWLARNLRKRGFRQAADGRRRGLAARLRKSSNAYGL